MMPISLIIENFQGHAYSQINFDDFNSALIVGKAKNNDSESNGVGKSTIFKAIEYVLFNKISAKQTEKIIRDNADFCSVKFIFSIENDIFKLERSRTRKGSSDLRIFKKDTNNEWEDKTHRRISDNEKEIFNLIKIEYESFRNSFLFEQKSDKDLASLTSEKRKALLKETLKLSHYYKYEKLAKKKLNDISKDLETKKIYLLSISSLLDKTDLQQNLNDIEIQKSTNELYFNEKQGKLDKLNTSLAELKYKFSSLEKESKEFDSDNKKISEVISKLNSSLIDYSNKSKIILSEAKKISSDIEDIKSSINFEQIKKIDDPIAIDNELIAINKLCIDKNVLLKTLQISLKELNIPIPNDLVCKYCRQSLTIEHKEKCKIDIENQKVEISSQISLLVSEISEINKEQSKLNNSLLEISNVKKNIFDLQNKLVIKQQEISNKKQLYTEYTNIISQNKSELEAKKQELDLLNKKQFISNFEEFTSLKKNIALITEQITSLNQEILQLSKKINYLDSQKLLIISQIEQRIKNQEDQINLKKDIARLERELKIAQLAAQSFGTTGIPSLIIHNILDNLQYETNSWLDKIKPGIQLKFLILKDNKTTGEQEDTLDIIFMIHGKERDYDLISGGQKLAISLAIRLGLAEILKKQMGTNIKMLLLDEVDQPLDDSGIESFSELIKDLHKEFKILVITHNNSLKHKFLHTILVEQDQDLVSTARLIS